METMEDFEGEDYRKKPIKEIIIWWIKFIVPEYLRNMIGELWDTIKQILKDRNDLNSDE